MPKHDKVWLRSQRSHFVRATLINLSIHVVLCELAILEYASILGDRKHVLMRTLSWPKLYRGRTGKQLIPETL